MNFCERPDWLPIWLYETGWRTSHESLGTVDKCTTLWMGGYIDDSDSERYACVQGTERRRYDCRVERCPLLDRLKFELEGSTS